MANLVTSLCCVVLAAVVVAYAQRRSQLVARNQYERMSSDVTMQCGSLDSDASVSWKVNGTDVKAQHRLEGPRLILSQVGLGHNGLYSCFQNPNGERRDTIYLHIGIPPREPAVTCRSNTYPKGFYCSWHQMHPTYIPTTFEVDVQHVQRSLEVQKDSVHKNRCHVRFPEVFSSFPYKVNVTAVNALGKASTTISFEESSIVKPDPPERVTATPIRDNPRRLEVTWHNPSTWPDIDNFPLKYFLRYRPLIREQWQHVELSDSVSHTITDAYAGKEYIIQVAAKDTEIGTWSDWSVAVHATPWIVNPVPSTPTTEVDLVPETRTSPIPSSKAPQKGEPPVGRAARLLTVFSPLLLGMLLLLM
ncbi:ciliary neurotrophic factor receptor subunit alpha isoform X1 [Betta splendens]|uniref:Ciliary neurotrophic factor receptor subunit alpha isoform X1 n=2 Tax=Betta splendens TaxID=158456 RepID=A0A6P7P2P7_BETSP|nr:ciliary neurotrophic factor receptor subunit alpha isoform X1 [Betta splendens]XP_029023943.1 ciliary neurotrophic factor receptor subunit alpha isoform X1 [Betta splendens]XP_029023944.1 ciliary neurotrophic factor receptor subunit alpha isoform X1 [Betta splendens]XP_029023945.1 ciliary neurotrophic factor receptor subunit alpha isoform X1 [Betta splendens]XP_029023946.1 ciliary neurotrophic factor receptor subunit alpha isoform X1 [Betta splendens]